MRFEGDSLIHYTFRIYEVKLLNIIYKERFRFWFGVYAMLPIHRLKIFKVTLSVTGINKEKDPKAKQQYEAEISFRPHLKLVSIDWDKEENRLILQLISESTTPDTVRKQLQEEFFEISNAILREIKGVHIQVIKVYEDDHISSN